MNNIRPLNQMSSMYGIYRGIVIKNNDPEGRGRVKVFLPTLARQMLSNMSSKNKQWCLSYLGDTIVGDTKAGDESASNKVLKIPDDKLHDIAGVLDWVDVVRPVFGGGTIAHYDATTKRATISDSGPESTTSNKETNNPRVNQYDTPPEPSSGGSNKSSTGAGTVDPNSKINEAPRYGNCAKGVFSIPEVGSHVFIQFEGGNVGRPLVVGVGFTSPEYKSVLQQNLKQPCLHGPSMTSNDPSAKDQLYTQKDVIALHGGVIESKGTQDFKEFNIADANGNSIVMNKMGMTESTALSQPKRSHINGDYFLNVKGNLVIRVDGKMETIVQGYEHNVRGNLSDVELQKQWLTKSQPVRDNNSRRVVAPTQALKDRQKQTHDSFAKSSPNANYKLPKGLEFSKAGTTGLDMLNITKST
jgi:hypothetical protein